MDDVLKEVRRIREEYAKKFNYDLWAIHADLKQQEQANRHRLVPAPPRPQAIIEKLASTQSAE